MIRLLNESDSQNQFRWITSMTGLDTNVEYRGKVFRFTLRQLSSDYSFHLYVRPEGSEITAGEADTGMSGVSLRKMLTNIEKNYGKIIEKKYSETFLSNAKPNSADVRLYDTVELGGYRWKLINLSRGIAALLSDSDFGESVFSDSEESNNYQRSIVRRYLNSDVLSKLEARGVSPIPTKLDDFGITDKVYLLSSSEAEGLPRSSVLRSGADWYLRTPSPKRNASFSNWKSVYFVSKYGDVFDGPNEGMLPDRSLPVRFAIRVRADDLKSVDRGILN